MLLVVIERDLVSIDSTSFVMMGSQVRVLQAAPVSHFNIRYFYVDTIRKRGW